MKSRIIFNGMNRHASPATAQPGDCSSVVNLRKQSGHLIPVGTPKYLYNTQEKDRRLLYVHTCYDGEHHITANDYALYYEVNIDRDSEKITPVEKELFTLNGSTALSVQSIGNTLIVICAEHTYYLLYKEGEYIFLGEQPDFPEISFSAYTRYTDAYIVPEHTFSETYNNPTYLKTEETNFYNGAYYDAFFQLQEQAWKRRYFIQPILIRYALTLYDGSCIFSSTPVMLSQANPIQPSQLRIRIKNSNNICTGTYEGQIIAENFIVKYFIHSLNLENWKDIVKSIDFFVTPEATIFETGETLQGMDFKIERTQENGNTVFYVTGDISFLDRNEIKKQYMQSSLFYKITSIEDWSNLKVGEWYDFYSDIRPDMLVHEEVLSPDNTTLLSTGAQVSYVLNKRLHQANLSRKMFPGFPLIMQTTGRTNAEPAEAYICTYLKTERGESMVVWSGTTDYFYNQLSPFISYPDSNAYLMEIVVKSASGLYRKRIELTPSEYENRADYLDDSFVAAPLEVDSAAGSSALTIPSPSNDVYTQDNILRVSKYENPFVFPAEQTYSVSNGAITGIASITTALSEGQFGEFPLYLFTEEGIWALQSGSGEVCYSNQHQLSREPISREYPIIPLEEAILFATPKGLSILQGATTQQLLAFDELPYEDNSKLQDYQLSSNILQATCDTTPLSDFIQGCIIAYNPIEKELLFCQPRLGYTVVLHLPSMYMYRTTQVYTSYLYDATHLLGQDEQGNIFDLQKEIRNNTAQIVLLTRPITLQSESYQRWRELSLRVSSSGKKTILSLWGGNDAENKFVTVGQLSNSGKIPGKLTLRITGPAYKYYRIFFSGDVMPDFHLWAADTLAIPLDLNSRLY